ncbi:MAG: 50S ribosomal protein L6 [Clostridia bacterium]|nr:50S ribosomal protein L6 [Clostridia bacterium]
MSRIGKLSIAIPAGVTVEFANGVVTVKGAKGELKRQIVSSAIDVTNADGHVHVVAKDESKETNALHGLYRALIADMVKGVSEGYTKALEIKGVGWKAAMQGSKLVLNVGFSHPVEFVQPAGIKIECPSQTDVVVSGIDKVLVGQVAADLRAIRVPEPYHGYGIRYKGEHIEHKEGKTSGKGKK